MAALNPRVFHTLDQFLALTLEVQASLRAHRDRLMEAGWDEAEAWAWCQRAEERILGPALDMATAQVRTIEEIDEMVRRALQELLGES